MKRTLLTLLLVSSAHCFGGEVDGAAFFGLSGAVTVREAKSLLDGGTIIIDLEDEHGISLHISKPAAWTTDEARNNFVTVSFPHRISGHYLLREGGDEEMALLQLLRQAALKTYGTADPPAGNLKTHAVRILIGILAKHTHEPQPQ